MSSTVKPSLQRLSPLDAVLQRPVLAWGIALLWWGMVCVVAFLWRLGSIGLVDETEPLFVEAARQMIVTGDWITPYFNGETRFEKPPLIYWLMAIAYQIFGVSEWSARLPSALSAIALTGLSAYTLRYFGLSRPPRTIAAKRKSSSRRITGVGANRQRWISAWLGTALIAFTPAMVVWGRAGVLDMLLTACIGGAMLTFFIGYASPERPVIQARWYLVFYLCLGLGVLTKGPVALLLPVLGIGAFLLYTDNMRQVLQELQLFWGSLVVILIALPWFAIESLIHGKTYLNAFFSYRTFFDPFTRVIDHHHSPSYFYFLIVLLGFLPFSIYLPVAIARLQVWRVRAWRSQPRAAQLGPFAVCWFACIFCFFTVAATKLPNFVLPLMPAAAILVVLLWSEQIATIPATRTIPDSLGFTLSSLANTAFLGLLALASWQLPQLIGPDSAAPLLPQAIRQANLPLLWGSIWTVAAVVGGLLVLRLQQQWLWLVNLVALIAFAIVAVAIAFPIVDIQRQQPLRELSQYAAREFHPGEAALMVGFWKPSVVFYMQHPVHFVAFPADLPQEIDRIAAEQPFTESMLILGEGASLAETGLQPNQYRKLSQAGAFQLMRVNVPLVDR